MASSASLGPNSAGASKTQASLARIIAVISSVPPPNLEPPRARGEERLDLSLRLGLPTEIGGGSAVGEGGGPTARGIAGGDRASGEVTATEESISAAESVVGEAPAAKSSDGECDPSGAGGRSPKETLPRHGKEEEEKKPKEVTEEEEEEEEEPKEATEEGEGEGEGEGGGGGGGGGKEEAGASRRAAKASNGYLDLLLEAVREVLGGFLDDEEGHEGAAGAEEEKMEAAAAAGGGSESRRRMRRRRRREGRCRKSSNRSTTAAAAAAAAAAAGSKRRVASWEGPLDVYEETAPIVRSKRGRSQTLPSRYRDSVLEPWTTKPPIVTRHGRAGRH